MAKGTQRTVGAFQLLEPIGRGANGVVWRGRHEPDGLAVAVKVLENRSANAAQAFRNEIRTVASLDHPNVVMVFDQGVVTEREAASSDGALVAGSPYLAMELAEGGTLDDLGVRPPWAILSELLRSIFAALAHAHARGVIHRDLKPSNVLFPVRGDVGSGVKLSDFGIAHAATFADLDDPRQTRLSGTLHFMAPEQLAGQYRDEGPWTDLYAVGIMTYQLVGGRPPWANKTRDELMGALLQSVPPVRARTPVPEDLQAWLDRLVARRPTERFQSAAEAAKALDALREPVVWGPGRKRTRPSTVVFDRGVAVPSIPDEPARSTIRLLGAGLGLYGLRAVPLSGRERERGLLWNALCECAQTLSPRVVVLHGPSGVGKSRLAQWLSQQAHEHLGAVQMRARHSPIAGPTDGLAPMISALLGCTGLSDEQTLARTERFLADHPLERDGPLDPVALAELVRIGPHSSAPLGARAEHRTLVKLVQRLGPRPSVIWLDDAQWGVDALAFCHTLLDLPEAAPAAVVVTLRDEELDNLPVIRRLVLSLEARAGVTRIVLDPLSYSDHERLVHGLLGLSEDLAGDVVERTRGNPLFAIQLVGEWVRRGDLRLTTRGFELRDDARVSFPESLHSLWQEQVHRLAQEIEDSSQDEVLATLEVAAALGQNVADNEWRAVSKLRDLRVPEALAETLSAHQLAVPNHYGWSFCHTMLRESLERHAREHGRWLGHQLACAEMLMDAAVRSDVIAGRRGQHLVEAEKLEDSVEPLLRGALAARRASDFHRAYGLLDLREHVLGTLGVEENDTRYLEGFVVRAPCLVTQGNIAAADELIERIFRAQGELPASLRARAESVRGTTAFARGDSDEATAALHRALSAYPPDDELARVDCLTRLGSIYMWRRELHRASQYFREAQEIIGDDPAYGFEQGQTLRGLAHIEHCEHNYGQAKMLMLEARGRFAENGHRFEAASCTNDLGELARHQGQYEEAEELYRQAEAMFETLGVADATTARCNQALLFLEQRRFAEAGRAFGILLSEIDHGQRQIDRLWIRGGLLACAAAARNWHDWDLHLHLVQDLLAGGFIDDDLAMVTRMAGELASEAGQPARAQEAYRIALRLYQLMNQDEHAEQVETALAAL